MGTEIDEGMQRKSGPLQSVTLIKVPCGLGAGRPGTEQGPDSVMEAGLGRMIRNLGRELAEECLSGPWCSEAETGGAGAGANRLSAIREVIGLTAERVAKAAEENAFPLVLGGDRSATVGAIAGLSGGSGKSGLIWFGAHPGLLTQETGRPGVLNGMALAAVLGRSGLDIPGTGRIGKENVVLIGTREVQPSEREWIRSEGIACFTMHDIDRIGIQSVIESALRIAGHGTERVHVSLDADCLDPLEAPGVGEPVPGGLFYREAHFAFELLAETGLVSSMDVTGVNALLDDRRRTGKLVSGLVASLLGKRIL